MKRLLLTFAILFACASAACAAPTAPLTSLRAIRALTNADASQHLSVACEPTVTYFRTSPPRQLFVQDGDVAIYVYLTKEARLVPGDSVLVRGTTEPSFRPIVVSNDVTVLRHGGQLKPEFASYNGIVHLEYLCRLVTIHAVVRSAEIGRAS